jgi:endonuclease-3
LEKEYPDAICSLNYSDAFQLLIATRLSAQCTDARVNIVTPGLFCKYPTPQCMAKAPVSDVEELIKTCGLYKTKAKDLIAIAQRICEVYDGKVPEEMDDLLTLSGVGRKTANLVRGDIFGHPAVVTDTHFIRLCNRLGFVNTKEPKSVEEKMLKLLQPLKSNDFCHISVLHGRAVCTARKAFCEKCCLETVCKKRMK